VAFCSDWRCPPAATRTASPGFEWKLLRAFGPKLRAAEIWVRKSSIFDLCGCKENASATKVHTYTKDDLNGLIARNKEQITRLRAPLVGTLCSSEQCHFRQSSGSLPQLLGLPGGPQRRPKYLTGRSETHFFGDDGGPGGALEGMPQLAFSRRRRGKGCLQASSLVRQLARRWSSAVPRLSELSGRSDGSVVAEEEGEELPMRETVSRGRVLAPPSQTRRVELTSQGGVRKSATTASGVLLGAGQISGQSELMMDAEAEVARATGSRRCAISNTTIRGRASPATFSDVLAAVPTAKSTTCGFEMVLPIIPEVSCKEEDGLGLSVDIAPNGVITERCMRLADGPTVDSYLLWVSLRPLGRHAHADLRATGRNVEYMLTRQFGYTKHAPFSRQPSGCIVGPEGEGSDKKGVTYVFRQELWSRRDPRLSEVALGITKESMCKEQERLMALPGGSA